MKLMQDIKSPWLIHLKGAFFVVLAAVASFLLIAQMPTLKTGLLLGIAVWASCRFYYYLFHVLERYLGRDQRYAGLGDALRFLFSGSRRG